MWSALKTDLFDFVNTIQEDTTKTLSRVLGDEEVDATVEEENMLNKWIANVKRSYETYANPLRENRLKEYQRYKRKFTLSGHTKEIAEVLDDEPEVSRFYFELVPHQISPDEFWARLFFRLQLLTRTGNVNFEEDDEEEELVWEDEEVPPETSMHAGIQEAPSVASLQSAGGSTAHLAASAVSPPSTKVRELEEENQKLRTQLSYLTNRVAQLELDLRDRNALIDSLNVQLQEATNPSKTASVPNDGMRSPMSSPSRAAPVIVESCGDNLSDNDASSEASGSSSALMVNHSETNSMAYFTDEDSRHGASAHGSRPGKAAVMVTHAVSKQESAVRAVSHSPAINENTSEKKDSVQSKGAEKVAYLASLEDDEEDGWN